MLADELHSSSPFAKARVAEEELKLMRPGEVRVRIAPSPTGSLHIGTTRTALFNYLFSQKNQGKFILRIEDTDLERSAPRFEKEIIENLKWLGIEWDEGPDIGGDYEPYRQSERLDIYSRYLEKLLKEEKAYYCFCSKEELEAEKQYQMSIGHPPRYSGKCRNLSRKEVEKNLAERKPAIIRFKVPEKKVVFQDLVRGKIEFDSSLLGDIAIAKNLNTPLYNFACVIDDFEMKISHVIRGEDHIPNTPKQILIQETLGFPQPKYAHLPLILGPDRTKLSKRHGATSIEEYRKTGYLPEALVNFMAFLGWNPGTEREIYSLASLIKEFSLEKVQKGGAVFNIQRLDYLNGFYIRQRTTEKLAEICIPYLVETGYILPIFESEPIFGGAAGRTPMEAKNFKIIETGEIIPRSYLEKIVALEKERIKKLSEVSKLADFFFKEKLKYSKELLKWQDMSDKMINKSLDRLEKLLRKIKLSEWNKENLKNILIPEAEKIDPQKVGDRGYLLWPFRAALSGKEASPDPFEIAEVLGKEKTLKRVKEARGLIK